MDLNERHQLQTGVEQGRQARHVSSVQIRKKKRDEHSKMRREDPVPAPPAPPATDLQIVTQNLFLSEPRAILNAVMCFRRLAGAKDTMIEAVFSDEILMRLVALMTGVAPTNMDIQMEAAWALSNIVAGESDQTHRLVALQGAMGFIKLYQYSSKEFLREQALWGIGNIAGETVEYRDRFIEAGVLTQLIADVGNWKRFSPAFVNIAVWTLCNMCKGEPKIPQVYCEKMLQAGFVLFKSDNEHVLSTFTAALRNAIGGEPARLRLFVNSGILIPMVEKVLVKSETAKAKLEVLELLGNVSSGTEMQTQYILDLGIVPILQQLLADRHCSVVRRQKSCWILANIAAGTLEQAHRVIASPELVIRLIELLGDDNIAVREELVFLFLNLSAMSVHYLDQVINIGGGDNLVQALAKNLSAQNADHVVRTLDVMTELQQNRAIHEHANLVRLFELDKVVHALEALLDHPLNAIRRRVESILNFTDEATEEAEW